jgi:hypothetical protein
VKTMRSGWMGVAQAMVVGVACLYWMVGVAQDDPTRPGTEGSKGSNAANTTPTAVPGVVIQINSDDEKDDYLFVNNVSGLPKTRCRAKLVEAFATDVTVDLKNDGVGQVRFPEEANDTKTITLISDGTTWTEFYISGKTKSDQKDDAKITAYKTGSTTAKVGQQDLTVYEAVITDADGTPITTTLTRSVGQKISLKASIKPAVVGQLTCQWTIPGSIVENYTVAADQKTASVDKLTDTERQIDHVSFYWVDGANNRDVVLAVSGAGLPWSGKVNSLASHRRPHGQAKKVLTGRPSACSLQAHEKQNTTALASAACP